MELIPEEFDHLQIKKFQLKATENAMMAKGGKGKGKKPWKGAGLSSGGLTNSDIKCWTCGKKVHIKTKCLKRSKKKSDRNKEKDKEVHTS